MNKKIFRASVIFIALVVIVVFAALLQKKSAKPAVISEPPASQTGQESPAPEPTPVQSATQPEMVSTGILHVKWSKPELIAPVDVFTDAYKGEGEYAANDYARKNYINPKNYLQVGLVKDGAYAGGRIVVVFIPLTICGIGGASVSYHFVIPKTGKPVLLEKHSPPYREDSEDNEPMCRIFDGDTFVVDTTAEARELILPEQVTHNEAHLQLTLGGPIFAQGLQIGTQLFDLDDKKSVFIDADLGTVYTDNDSAQSPQNGLYAIAPDGTVRTYRMIAPFYDEQLHVPQVTWSDGSKNVEEYSMTDVGGCGEQNYASVLAGVTKTDLVAVGATMQNENVYGFKDANHPVLKNLYQNFYLPRVQGDTDDALSYEQFVKSHSVFVWIDPFGRAIKFQKATLLPEAECGKPVIYLYPQKPADVSVKLDPKGGFTKTEPAYDGGWNVHAMPDGELTNLKDGKTYPYLFWEGRGGLYETPKQGFVVAQNDVHGFLAGKLSALGLNGQERADFMDFWEPRMTGAPWYFVTFLGNRAMDALAPLTIAPKPDTVIRILMDFQPLEKPIQVQGYPIHTPERKGFTVVEWGGVLR